MKYIKECTANCGVLFVCGRSSVIYGKSFVVLGTKVMQWKKRRERSEWTASDGFVEPYQERDLPALFAISAALIVAHYCSHAGVLSVLWWSQLTDIVNWLLYETFRRRPAALFPTSAALVEGSGLHDAFTGLLRVRLMCINYMVEQ